MKHHRTLHQARIEAAPTDNPDLACARVAVLTDGVYDVLVAEHGMLEELARTNHERLLELSRAFDSQGAAAELHFAERGYVIYPALQYVLQACRARKQGKPIDLRKTSAALVGLALGIRGLTDTYTSNFGDLPNT